MKFNQHIGLIVAAGLTVSACGAQATDAISQTEFDARVEAVILDNPEIVEKALLKLQKVRRAEMLVETKRKIEGNAEQIYNDPRDFSIGPDDAPVTVVEFFDYRCSACRYSAEWVESLPEKYDGKVRVVFKEFPILSEGSKQAAVAALAAGRLGAYTDMHKALMLDESDMSQEDLKAVAAGLSVDVDALGALMASEELASHIDDNGELAKAIGVDSTPTFVIGDTLVVGGDPEALERQIAAQLNP
jgi:protein-disulfide isomerase